MKVYKNTLNFLFFIFSWHRLAQLLLRIESTLILSDGPKSDGINIPSPQVSELINIHNSDVSWHFG